jgi:hypothetical protein
MLYMSSLIHKTDGGLMKKLKNGVKCQKCGYFVKDNEITQAYLHGKIELPIRTGPAKMNM